MIPTTCIVSFDHCSISKRNDGIIEVTCDENVCYEIYQLKEISQIFSALCSNKRYPMLFVAGQYTSISSDARTYGATEEATKYSKAEAYVLNSIAQHLLANFYLRFNKPSVPTKFFSCKKEAEIWLKSFM